MSAVKDVSHTGHVLKIINMMLHITGVPILKMLTVEQGPAMTPSTAQIALIYSKMGHSVVLMTT